VLRHEKGVWSEERIVAELAAWARKHGRYPTGQELARDGLQALHGARRRLFHRRSDALRSLVEQRCGRALPRRIAAPGSYDTRSASRSGSFSSSGSMAIGVTPIARYTSILANH
jgi:hypothetical protein